MRGVSSGRGAPWSGRCMESAPVRGFTAQEGGDGVQVMGLDRDRVFWTVGGCG